MKSAKRLNRKLVKSRLTKKRRQVSSGGGLDRSKKGAMRRKEKVVNEPGELLKSRRESRGRSGPGAGVSANEPLYDSASPSSRNSAVKVDVSPLYSLATQETHVSEEPVSGKHVSGKHVSEGRVSEERVSGESVSAEPIFNVIPPPSLEKTKTEPPPLVPRVPPRNPR